MDFKNAKGKKILEVGVGGGVDFSSWLKADAKAVGLDLTEAGVRLTKQRLTAPSFFEESYNLNTGDAGHLAFEDKRFDQRIHLRGIPPHTQYGSGVCGGV